ncbi:hypothetical protein BaRGS_00003366 [Batillaria attramentaria]|uniref:Uncharacterized protein n=1 Tax=Batillaria attramentaria TaxID=370345 RepID=A0ABD0LZU6_9CAEN
MLDACKRLKTISENESRAHAVFPDRETRPQVFSVSSRSYLKSSRDVIIITSLPTQPRCPRYESDLVTPQIVPWHELT